VDAAAEVLTLKPNVHLQRGATVVAYSGGKCIRGPQAAGVLLGQKDFLRAAWVNSAPHHAFGRSLKVGKEEIMGMLAAVEMWVKRDHKAEWAAWESWLDHIGTSAKRVDSVTAQVRQPSSDLSNRTPELSVQWDPAKVGINGLEVRDYFLDTEPRIVLAAANNTSVRIVPYQMSPGDEKIVADRLYAVLSKPPKISKPPAPEGPTANVAGQWEVQIQYLYGSAHNRVVLEQEGTRLMGTHHGEFASGDLTGTVAANTVQFRSSLPTDGQRVGYDFKGKLENGKLSGTVDLGEYGDARWTAEKHQYRTGRNG
jgi:L-seryl-tRNA(Ser) seleniumtransferase